MWRMLFLIAEVMQRKDYWNWQKQLRGKGKHKKKIFHGETPPFKID